MRRVAEFDAFTEGSDPYVEHTLLYIVTSPTADLTGGIMRSITISPAQAIACASGGTPESLHLTARQR
ncbi:hypothetical protein [Methylocystis hirsuta]|uniref:hypothetical protein n=1 Tax=Methylocystis hirsuta TaxID=369798 RepID=UPI0011CE4322|nr:hypothetical protein [Methylocystis hirsuta]